MNRYLLMLFIACRFAAAESAQDKDWLVKTRHPAAEVRENKTEKTLTLANGLVERVFYLAADVATISLKYVDGDECIRGLKPEALVTLNGRAFKVGGLSGQPDYAFLQLPWLSRLQPHADGFHCQGYTVEKVTASFQWRRLRYAEDRPWPPHGIHLALHFAPPSHVPETRDLELTVHFEMYDGVPVVAKWLSLVNRGAGRVSIDRVTTELIAVVERESDVGGVRTTKPRTLGGEIDPNDWARMSPLRLRCISDYAFCGSSNWYADQTTYWQPDEEYLTQVNYDRIWPHLLTCRYPYGPDVLLEPGARFTSFRNYLILFDSDDHERRGLTLRKIYRTLAPWCTENPIMMHLRYADSESIRRAVDQCAEVGFEMVICSFGSGLDMEKTDPAYLEQVRADFAYAHSKGVEIGGYSLLASRSISPEVDVIDPKTGKPGAYFGHSPCLVSSWGDEYFARLKTFIAATGANILEHDGSYPGDLCASTAHRGHRGVNDSQYRQFGRIQTFYHWCREQGIYLNVPDWYFLNGSNKTAMGYRETNWSLPRDLQIIHGRQNMYDGTFEKTPSMGWMFLPLVEYQGGGAAATIEPLSEHLDTYEAHLAQNFGSGVQACYRGPRLFDTEVTKMVVAKWVAFYKKHRAILDSDIIHLRRPDGRDIDAILHVNPALPEKGLAMVYNPLDHEVTRQVTLPLYYTGLSEQAHICEQEGAAVSCRLDRDYKVTVPVKIKAKSFTWLVIKE